MDEPRRRSVSNLHLRGARSLHERSALEDRMRDAGRLLIMVGALTACSGDHAVEAGDPATLPIDPGTAGGDMMGSSGDHGGGVAVHCAPDNGGIALPPGFCATVFADHLGKARHMA